jgi:hypothetical protein
LNAFQCVTGPSNPAGQFELASDEEKNKTCNTLNQSGRPCEFQPELLRTLSYQAITDVFNRRVQGTVGLSITSLSPQLDVQSRLFDTSLLSTKELSFLQRPFTGSDSIPSLPQLIDQSSGDLYTGLYDDRTISSNVSLATALEHLFQNITISLLSEQLLQ